MVFDLVVEATVPEVRDRVSYDVAAGQHLLAEEAHLAVVFQEGHGLMVGGEDRNYVGAEKPAMNRDEEQSLQRFQHREQQTEVQREVRADHQGFAQRALRLLRGKEIDGAA